MIENELLILGLLKESPRHGYEIKLRVKQILSLFSGLNLKSVYYPLSVLERKGLVKRCTRKPGKRPQRFVYTLTNKGQMRFEELLTKSLLELKRPQFSLHLSLYFLNYIQPKVAQRRLKGRIFILNKLSRDIKQMIKNRQKKSLPLSLSRILEHNLKMLQAESGFLADLIKAL